MKQVHIKQKLIASAIVGALMIPGSAMVVDATDTDENVNLIDEAGNIQVISIQVKIDKTAPIITGVENEKRKY